MSSDNKERCTDREVKEKRKREYGQQTFKTFFGGCWVKKNESQKRERAANVTVGRRKKVFRNSTNKRTNQVMPAELRISKERFVKFQKFF